MNQISPSAKGVAYLRHLEVEVSKDTLATYFYDEEGKRIARHWLEHCPYLRRTVAIRGRYIEDMAERYVRERGIKQMINIAAGLNTFPYRHPAASLLDVYAELDLPSMIEFKEGVFNRLLEDGIIEQPNFEIWHIPADLSKSTFPADFLGMDWNRQAPSIYVLEGMSYYLPIEILQGVIDTFYDTMAPGSIFMMDYFPDHVRNNKELTAILDNLPKKGAETCVTYLSGADAKQLLSRFDIVSDRLEDEMEREYYSDQICKPIGSIIVAEKA